MTPNDETIQALVSQGATLIGSRENETPEELKARINRLESDLALINAGKDAAERALKYERDRARELAQNGTLSLKRDWVALSNELQQLKGEKLGDATEKDQQEYQEALVIDFVNRLRIGALAELETDDDETLYVKAKAYEVWYRACTATLQNRAIRIKIEKRDEFEQTKRDVKKKESDARIAKEQDKLDKRRRTPEEKLMESLISLGMSETEAKAQMQRMNDAAKLLKN